MKWRYIGIFVSVFIFAFVGLNIRFFSAYLTYRLRGAAHVSVQGKILPVADYKFDKKLPDSAQIIIEKIGVSAPVVFNMGDTQDHIYSGLERGAVHLDDSPKPGERGTSFVFGHSSAFPWYSGKYGSVFSLLSELQSGDTIYVRYSDGRMFRYIVKDSIIFNPFASIFNAVPSIHDIAVLNHPDPKSNTLVLISCWPVGTNYKRIAIEATLQ